MNIKKLLIKLRRSKYVERILSVLFFVASKLPAKENTIVFESFLGKQYSDNPKALYLFIKSHYPEYQLFWSVDKNFRSNFLHEDLKIVPRLSLKWIFVMARAKIWISNSRLPLWITKPKHTVYIQTWHGTPLKKLGIDIETVHMPGTNTDSYKKNFLYEASKWDYLISPNAYSSEIFKRAFGFKKEIIESGYPRNDVLYTHNNEQFINKLKLRLNLPLDKKVILYAPTWRDNSYFDLGKYKFNLELDLQKLKQEFEEDFVVILRMHYLVAQQFDLTFFGDFVYNYSTYNDISELYLISDVLITDYSSVFFDYANLKKPILFFTYDIENYRDELRGFYFDIEDKAPGPLVKTTDEIVDYLIMIRDGNYHMPPSFEKFYNTYCYLEDGNASERVINRVINEK